MKPILQNIQKQIIETLQKETSFQSIAIFPETFEFFEKLATKITSLAPTQLYVAVPFPLETVAEISDLCWEKLSLQCTLMRKSLNAEKTSFLDLAESICAFISHKEFYQEQWEGRFVLESKNPWKWLEIENGLGLQMHFITSQFSILF